ncbi:radical SAM protein [soil metagenome]
MRILFVDNLLFEGSESRPWFDLQPHLGLMSLAAVAQAGGHEAIIFDPKRALVDGDLTWTAALYADMARTIADHAPDIVGFTALGCNFHCVVRVARLVRSLRPDLPIIIGGPHATILHKEILERLDCFDAVARHEAEEILLPMLAGLETGSLAGVAGVSWRDHDGRVVCNQGTPQIDALDELPMPAYGGYPIATLGLGTIRIEAGRGCPFSCTFCSTASFFGRSYRLKSSGRIVEEMDRLNADHGFTDFKLNHDLFTVNRKKVADFCAEVASRGYQWACSARADCVDTELLEAMAAAGCRNIYFGVETGSAAVQDSSRKRLDLALVEPVLTTTARLGINTTTSFIIGYPEETFADQCATLDMAGRLHRLPLNRSQIHLLTPEPGTALLDRHGASLRFDGRRCGFNLPRFGEGDGELILAQPALFVTHYHFATQVPRERNVLIAELWQQLAPLECESYAFLLDHWAGRLSALAEKACKWWAATAVEGVDVPKGALAAFAETIFGRDAPIVSLLRFATACDGVPAGRQGLRTKANSFESPQLARDAAVLRDIHDIPRLGTAVLQRDCEARTHLVVVRAAAGRPLRAYQIDEVTADLLSILDAPGGDAIAAYIDEADVARMRALHIIEGEPMSAPPRRVTA